jgi:hypothetical protein
MKKTIINEIEYDLINSYEEVNLETYYKIVETLSNTNSNIEKVVKLISIISGINEKEIMKMKSKDISEVDLAWLNDKSIGKEIYSTFELNGVKYGVVKDLRNMTFGENIDIETYIGEDNKFGNYHFITAVLYRPIISEVDGDYDIGEYNSDTLNKRAELFLNELSVIYINPIVDFFLNILKG